MTEQSIAVAASCVASAMLIAAYVLFYRRERRPELAFWSVGWTLLLIRFAVDPYLHAVTGPAPRIFELLQLAGNAAVLWGTLAWLGRRSVASACVLGVMLAVCGLTVMVEVATGAASDWLRFPSWAVGGAIVLWTGLAIFSTTSIKGLSKYGPGMIFASWGLFSLLLPRELNGQFDLTRHVAAAVLGLMATAGLLVAYLDRQWIESEAMRNLLRESQARAQAMFENSADAAYLLDMRGYIRETNPAGARLLGYERSELVGQHIRGVCVGEVGDWLVDFLNKLDFSKPVIGTNMGLHKDGSQIPLEVNVSLLQMGQERLALGVARDISARLRAEEGRRQSEERLRAIIDHHYQLTALLDAEARVIVINRAALTLAQATADEVVGKHLSETPFWGLSPEFRARMVDGLPAVQRGEFVRFEARFRNPAGLWRNFDVSFSPILDSQGKVVYIVPEGRDITELREAQEALRRAQSERALILDTMQELVVQYDTDSRIVWANRAAARAAGVEVDALVGRSCRGLWHHPKEAANDGPLGTVRSTGRAHEAPVHGADGRVWHVRAYPMLDLAGSVSGMVEFSQDITHRLRMEEELRLSEIKYRTYINNAPSAIFVTDAEGLIIDVNPAGCAMTGYGPIELTAMRLSRLLAPRNDGAQAKVVPGSQARAVFRRRDGVLRWCATSSSVLHDGKSITFATEITDVVEAERQLRLAQFAVDRAGDEVFWVSSDGKIIYANDAATAATGVGAGEILALHVWEIIEDFEKAAWPGIWERIKASEALVLEAVKLVKGGVSYPVEIVANTLDFEGQSYACAIVRDITARQKAQRALRESETRYRLVAENIADIIWTRGRDLERLAYVSPSVTSFMGYTPEEMMDLRLEEFMTPASAETARAQLKEVFDAQSQGRADTGTRRFEAEWRRKDGSTVWTESTMRPIRGAEGELIGVVGVTRNISDRRRSEHDLRTSEARYRTLVENIPQRIFMKDRDSRYLSVNASYARDLGRAPAEIIGSEDYEFYPRELAEKYRTDDRMVMNSGVPLECDEDYLDGGKKRTIHTIKSPVKDETGRVIGVLGVFSDITERRITEEALRRSEERYRTLFETAIDGIILADAQTGRLIDCNQALADMVGRSRTELIGASPSILQPPTEEGAGLAAIFQGGSGSRVGQIINARLMTRDGRFRDVAAKGHLITLEGRHVLQAIFRDNTESNRLEEQLRQAQKMEVVGQLAGGIAHDFRNQLTVVQGYAEMLEQEPGLSQETRDMIAEILKAVHRSADMTGRLLALGRKQRLEPRVVNLVETLGDLAKSLPRLVGEDVRVRMTHRQGVCRANLDPMQFQQAVINMVINARHAMPAGGELTIETETRLIAPEVAARNPELQPGLYAVVSVADTGTGIEPTALSHIFEPFFTTKKEGVGTGLGLAIVYGFVKQSGGTIEVDSSLGSGSVFRLYFPSVQEAAPVVANIPAEPSRLTRVQGSVLLVEDEPSVREVVARVLRGAGYRLSVAGSAAEALELANAPDFSVDFLVTDVVMPGAGGPELARQMSRKFPALKVLFITGYPGRQLELHGLPLDVAAVLSKPFTAAGLLKAVAGARPITPTDPH